MYFSSQDFRYKLTAVFNASWQLTRGSDFSLLYMKKKKNENKRRVRECEKETQKKIVIKKEGKTMTRVREA